MPVVDNAWRSQITGGRRFVLLSQVVAYDIVQTSAGPPAEHNVTFYMKSGSNFVASGVKAAGLKEINQRVNGVDADPLG